MVGYMDGKVILVVGEQEMEKWQNVLWAVWILECKVCGKFLQKTYWRGRYYFRRPTYKSKISAQHIGAAVTQRNCNFFRVYDLI